MTIESAEYFYENYVGSFTSEKDYASTVAMIQHYLDSGLRESLLDIYEACARDKMLSAKNIPSHLWKRNNLVVPGVFYLHPALKLVNPPPMYDAFTDTTVDTPYYCEIKERFTIQDVERYAIEMMQERLIYDREKNAGAIQYLLKRYWKIQKTGLQSLDIVLFLIDEAKGQRKELVNLTDNEDAVYQQLTAYNKKLLEIGMHNIVWRDNIIV